MTPLPFSKLLNAFSQENIFFFRPCTFSHTKMLHSTSIGFTIKGRVYFGRGSPLWTKQENPVWSNEGVPRGEKKKIHWGDGCGDGISFPPCGNPSLGSKQGIHFRIFYISVIFWPDIDGTCNPVSYPQNSMHCSYLENAATVGYKSNSHRK